MSHLLIHSTPAAVNVRLTGFPTSITWRKEQIGEVPDTPAAASDPECNAILQQQRERLHAAVEELLLNDRQVVILQLEGLSAARLQEVQP